MHAVGILVDHGVVVVDVAELGRRCGPGARRGPTRATGGSSRIAQAALSRLWTCCSTLWSPESQVK